MADDTSTDKVEDRLERGNVDRHDQPQGASGSASEGECLETTDDNSYDSQLGRDSTEVGQLDLTDPEALIQMLGSVDLSEEDTDQLLQEAYKMNKKLKELLRTQALGGSRKVSRSDLLTAQPDLFRRHTTLNKSAVLPPIGSSKLPTGIYDIKRTRSAFSRNSISSASAPHSLLATHKKTMSTSNAPSGEKSRSSCASHKNVQDKPAWDDRFSFS